MSADIDIRKSGVAGRITLNRPEALNALTCDMCLEIEKALNAWAVDDTIELVIIDAAGDRAFCAGGDIAQMYKTGTAGDFEYGRKFWADEYRLNAKVFEFPKPYVAFMQGFTMGGGVGVSCHGSHRIVGETSKIAMPECGIGLIPDVGGSLLLARAPGRLGEYLGTTGARMNAADAIHAEFADYFIPQSEWPALISELEKTGDHTAIDRAAVAPAPSQLAQDQHEIDSHFGGETIGDIVRSIKHTPSAKSERLETTLRRPSPLSVACCIELVHRVRAADSIRRALEMEYRFTYRSAENGDFLEGIRAMIIDKGDTPNWRHSCIEDVTAVDVAKMLMPLGDKSLTL